LADGSYAKAERRSDDGDFRSQRELLKTAAMRITPPSVEAPKVPVSPAPLFEAAPAEMNGANGAAEREKKRKKDKDKKGLNAPR
jgi:hypothetical protein